jgi:hypothetical protein
MDSFWLKIIGCVSMLADHVGSILFPQILILRIIGRLAFPIFAFLVVEGYRHTQNFKNYLLRIFVFFIVSEPIYRYAHYHMNIENLNIFATLLLGLVAIYLYDHINNKKYAFFCVFLTSILSYIVKADYGFFGIFLIFFFYLYDIKKDFYKLFFIQLLLIAMYVFFMPIQYASIGMQVPTKWILGQFIFLLPLFMIKYYDGKRGKYSKYLFYVFYPGHLLLIGFVARFL